MFIASVKSHSRLSVVLTFLVSVVLAPSLTHAQSQNAKEREYTTSEVKKNRLTWSLITGGVAYTATSITLYESWYKDFPQSGFHFYNDIEEWRGVDKTGHVFAGYFQTDWAYKGWKWTGLSDNSALWAGAATSLIAQTTIEVMDGFSTEWGFSIPDFAANILGTSSYVLQQRFWGEQRIRIKTSGSLIDYEERYGDQAFADRATALYGEGFLTRFLKDYNAQTTWLSVNLKSFAPRSKLPSWLNVAVGYGAENMFGGFTNYVPDLIIEPNTPRYSQILISLDADLSKIDVDTPFLRTLLDILNVIKVPFSTIEINTLGEVKFYGFYF